MQCQICGRITYKVLVVFRVVATQKGEASPSVVTV